MINLSEEWKKAYDAYLLAEEEKEDTFDQEFNSLFEELMESQRESRKSFDLLQEYYTIYAISEGILDEEILNEQDPDEMGNGEGDVGGGMATKRDKKDKIGSTINSTLTSMISNLSRGDDFEHFNDLKDTAYAPVATYTIEKIGDMKFPNNLFFFIKQIAAWVIKVVLYFIERFKNMIRGFLGKPITELNPEALKLKFEKAKKVETVSKVIGLQGGGAALDKMLQSPDPEKQVKVNLLKIPGENITVLGESSLADALGITKKPDVQKETHTMCVSMDLSQDIARLKDLVDHFYKLFDEAYGSNREKLFEVGDLKIILEIFKGTLSRLKNGEAGPTLMLGQTSVEVQAISESRVKENLIITNNNITALKKAYQDTAAKIGDIAKIINSKELLMLTDLGVTYHQLSSATYNSMMNLALSSKGRLRTAEKLYRDLTKMDKNYKHLVAELRSMQTAVLSTSNITYDAIYNRKVTELLNSAKYMSDTVTLRLVGLGLYIKQLKDVRDILKLLATVSSAGRNK